MLPLSYHYSIRNTLYIFVNCDTVAGQFQGVEQQIFVVSKKVELGQCKLLKGMSLRGCEFGGGVDDICTEIGAVPLDTESCYCYYLYFAKGALLWPAQSAEGVQEVNISKRTHEYGKAPWAERESKTARWRHAHRSHPENPH